MTTEEASGSPKYIERIFLRPHHIAAIKLYKGQSGPERKADFNDNIAAYGRGFAEDGLIIFQYVSDDTVVNVVSGLDDICRAGCPFIVGCEKGDYSGLVAAMLNSIGPDQSKDAELIRQANPENSDLHILERLTIDIGGTYRFGDIRRKEKKPEQNRR